MRFPEPVTDPTEHVRAARAGRRDDLVLWHGRLAAHMARKFKGGDPTDYLSVALEALCRAAKMWDFEDPRAVQHGFRPYATTFMWNALCKTSAHERHRWRSHLRLEDLVLPRGHGNGRRAERLINVLVSLPERVEEERVRKHPPRRARAFSLTTRQGRPTLAGRIQDHLREHGPATTNELARALGASPEGCKYQIGQLCREGMLVVESKVPTRGRPSTRYRAA